jgi:hypothetical protein
MMISTLVPELEPDLVGVGAGEVGVGRSHSGGHNGRGPLVSQPASAPLGTASRSPGGSFGAFAASASEPPTVHGSTAVRINPLPTLRDSPTAPPPQTAVPEANHHYIKADEPL